MDLSRKLAAEFLGTFWLVLGGCGAAVLAAGVPNATLAATRTDDPDGAGCRLRQFAI